MKDGMRKSLLVAGIMFLLLNYANSQITDGLYFISNGDFDCFHRLKKLNEPEEEFCLLQRPILKSDRFQSVGEIFTAQDDFQLAFDLQLDSIGSAILLGISSRLQKKELGLIIDQELIAILSFDQPVYTGKFRFRQDSDSKDIYRIREFLLSTLEN